MTSNTFNYCVKQEYDESPQNRNICSLSKIPRPPNAFMLYATENRKIMSHQFPADSNKVISKKLGSNWKNLNADEKNKYFEKARLIAIEHKEKYPHYVYNPKEARLRKAMREAASRDRSIGASPMLPRPNARRAGSAWGTPGVAAIGAAGSITPAPHGPHEEPLIMSPLSQGMRGPGLDSPCFPMSNPGSEQFMATNMGPAATAAGASAGYAAKMHQDASLPPPPAPTPVVHPSYMQTNPLTQLQQQTELWHNYQEDMRPRSTSNPYMMQDIQSPYHHHQPSPPLSIPSPMMMDQHRQTPGHSIHPINPISTMTPPHSSSVMSMTPPHSNENVPPDEPLPLKEKTASEDGESKQPVEAMQPLMENNLQHHSEYGSNVYPVNVQGIGHHGRNMGQQFEKVEDVNAKRVPYCNCQKNISCKNSLYLPLSCTNFCASPDLYTNNLEYQREYIAKYFHSLPEYEVHNLRAEDGLCFPYASRINFCDDINSTAADCPQLSFLKTDVGFIPLTFDSNFSDYWSKFKR